METKVISKKKIYQTDFFPVFHTINQCLDQLDQLGVVSFVGDKVVRAFSDSFVQLVWRTWDALPFDAPMSSSDQCHAVDPKNQ